MPRRIALYDSCVLYPAPLRDLLVRLAGAGLVQARWTDEIHEEWIRSVLESRPDLSRERLERTRDLMNEHILGSVVIGYERHISSIVLPDADDRHVAAAAIEARAEVIVTVNLRDFPDTVLSGHGIRAVHPDDLVRQLLDEDEETVCAVVRRQRLDLTNPPQTIDQLLDTLAKQGLVNAVTRLRQFAEFCRWVASNWRFNPSIAWDYSARSQLCETYRPGCMTFGRNRQKATGRDDCTGAERGRPARHGSVTRAARSLFR